MNNDGPGISTDVSPTKTANQLCMKSKHILGKDRVRRRGIPNDDAFTNPFVFKRRIMGRD